MTEAPKPVFVLIGLIALAMIAAEAYVAWQASLEPAVVVAAK